MFAVEITVRVREGHSREQQHCGEGCVLGNIVEGFDDIGGYIVVYVFEESVHQSEAVLSAGENCYEESESFAEEIGVKYIAISEIAVYGVDHALSDALSSGEGTGEGGLWVSKSAKVFFRNAPKPWWKFWQR